MATDTVLVVDADERQARQVCAWLEGVGYATLSTGDGREGLRLFFQLRPDLALIDVIAKGMDGLELCRRIREVSDAPVIFLSAKAREEDKVAGLKAGGDDYVAWPVGRQELLARVEAALRRATSPSVRDTITVYTDPFLSLDFARQEVYVRGALVHLTPLEYRLLEKLVQGARVVLTHDQLLNAVWGAEYEGVDSVKWHIGHLRRKLRDRGGASRAIVTVRGRGYLYRPPDARQVPGLPFSSGQWAS